MFAPLYKYGFQCAQNSVELMSWCNYARANQACTFHDDKFNLQYLLSFFLFTHVFRKLISQCNWSIEVVGRVLKDVGEKVEWQRCTAAGPFYLLTLQQLRYWCFIYTASQILRNLQNFSKVHLTLTDYFSLITIHHHIYWLLTSICDVVYYFSRATSDARQNNLKTWLPKGDFRLKEDWVLLCM